MDSYGPSRAPNLDDRTDEELVWLVQSQTCPEAKPVLLARHAGEVREQLVRLARHAGLHSADAEDAAQKLALRALHRAIRRYDLAQLTGPNPCRFRTFLHHVVEDCFRDFLRDEGRARCKEERVRREAARARTRPSPSRADGWQTCSPELRDEPSLLAQRAEVRAELNAAVAALPPEERSLLEESLACDSVAELAHRLGQWRTAVEREQERIYALLREWILRHRADRQRALVGLSS